MGGISSAASVGLGVRSSLSSSRRELAQESPHFIQGFGHEGVVDPAAVPAVGDQSRVLEAPEVEGETGLSRAQLLLQVADTPFPVGEELDNLQSGLFGEGLEPLKDRVLIKGRLRHGGSIYQRMLMEQYMPVSASFMPSLVTPVRTRKPRDGEPAPGSRELDLEP